MNQASQFTWTNTQTFSNTITFSGNSIINSTAHYWVGNTTTSPTVTLANTGSFTIGNSSTTQTTSVISVANSIGNVQITPNSLSVANSLTQIVTNPTSITVGNSTVGSVFVGNSTTNVSINTTSVYIQSATSAANGFCWLPNGLKLNWASVAVNSSSGNVTFSSAYTTNAFSVTVSPKTTSLVGANVPYVLSINSTVAVIRSAQTGAGNSVYVTAIGA